MMDDKFPTPNNTPPIQELSDTLRPAAEKVRAVAPPSDAVERSIDRAQRLGPPPPRRHSRRLLAYSSVAVIAAAILICFWLWPDRAEQSPEAVAEITNRAFDRDLPRAGGGGAFGPRKQAKKAADGTSNTIAFRGFVATDDAVIEAKKAEDKEIDSKPNSPLPGVAMSVRGSSTNHTRPGQPNVPNAYAQTDIEARLRPSQRGGEGKGGKGGGGGSGSGSGSGMMDMRGRSMGMNGGMMGMSGGGAAGPQGATGKPPSDFGLPTTNKPRSLAERTKAADELKRARVILAELKQVTREQESIVNTATPGQMKDADLAKKKARNAKEEIKTLEDRISRLKTQAGKPDKNEPQVWHRDHSRPTFARVYIGDGNSLELVSLHVSVTIEGPRARIVVDHIFRNPHNRQLEGTFEYPLPSGASPSYFAMFLGQTRNTVPALFGRRGNSAPLPAEALAQLTPSELVKHVDRADWGQLQEGRIVSKQKALETYEEVVRGRIDPALLEYAGGNTFSGRVFPIPPQGYNRVILAYEELLPFAQKQMLYRFPLPGCTLNELQLRLQAMTAECLQPAFLPKDAQKEEHGGRITFSRTWKDSKPEGEAVFACTPAHLDVQAVSGRQGDNGPRYAYARLRPALKAVAAGKPFASHAVFLLDTSLSEHPDRFAVNMKLLQKILETDTNIKRFNILTFNVGAAWLDPKGYFDNTAAGREKALKRLDGLVLEGATDIACALDKLAAPGFDLPDGTPLTAFLFSDGHITWGEPDVAALVARFEQQCPYPTRFHCYRTGLGEENSELFEALTRRGGGVFQCYGEAEVEAAAQAHRSQCLQVQRVRFVGGPQASDVLVSGRRAAVYPGSELVVAARFNGTGRTTVLVEGEFAGQKMVQEFPLEVRSESELAPRAWAEIAVSSLLALHDDNFDSLVTAYCQQFGIVSRVASFLVLENEADYKRFNLEEERGRTVAGDLGDFLAETWSQLGKRLPAAKAFERFLNQVDKRVNLLNNPESTHIKQLLAALTEADFELPSGSIRGGLVHQKDVAAYLEDRERDRRNVSVYLSEARRRAESGDVDGAVRVLSSIVEEHPSRGDALRLVGYRLLDLQQPAQAARLFSQVQKQRPFEPHSYRDLAHALEHSGRYGLAALNYEIILAGNWHNRFRQELKLVAKEEYAHMMQDAIRRRQASSRLADLFGERLEQMARPQPKSDLRVTISWNTDATDVDLWVIEPDGTKCFYQHNRTQNGGELSQDQTQGYGPERYQIAKAHPGVYTILVHYFSVNPNLLGGETHVSIAVTRFAGTPQEKTERHTVILKQHNQQVEVCKVKF
jgi:tetratricopeptide (TPR) repeat protein